MDSKFAVEGLKAYLKKHPKKYLCFDFDWTLVLLKIDWKSLCRDLYKDLCALDNVYMSQFGKVSFRVYNLMIKKHGQRAETLIKDYYQKYEKELCTGVDYNYELLDFIKSSAGDYQFYIWSSNQRKTIDLALGERYRSLFTRIVSANDIQFFKPDPDGFLKHLFEPKTQGKSQWLLVGDSNDDAAAASAAGIEFFKLKFK